MKLENSVGICNNNKPFADIEKALFIRTVLLAMRIVPPRAFN